MSDFLGRIGQITEWVVVSNVENRAINAAFNKTESWWKNRKGKKGGTVNQAPNTAPPPPLPPQSQANYAAAPPPYQPPQGSYAPPTPQYQPFQASYVPPTPPPSMGATQQLFLTVNYIDGLSQWGPLMVFMECNRQQYQTPLGGSPQSYAFPVYQLDRDMLYVWIQTQYQQTVAQGEIAVQLLLNKDNSWASPQQHWIPLRDQHYGSVGQLVVTAQSQPSYPSSPPPPQPPPYMPDSTRPYYY